MLFWWYTSSGGIVGFKITNVWENRGKEFLRFVPSRLWSTRTCHHISKHRTPFLQAILVIPESLSACLPQFRGQCPSFHPSNCSSLPLFSRSRKLRKRISLDDVWTCPRIYIPAIDGIRRERERRREGVFYSGWKERILSSVGYRLGFRLGGGENEAKGGWSLTMTIVRPPTRRERGRRMNFWTENSIVPSPGVGESVKSDLISR